MCETNPISGDRDTPRFQYSIVPVFQSDAYRARQSQSGSVSGGDAKPSIRSMAGSTKSRLRKTKPNLGRMGYLEGASGRPMVRNEANLWADSDCQGPAWLPTSPMGPIVRNEANLPHIDRVSHRLTRPKYRHHGAGVCKTKPISARRGVALCRPRPDVGDPGPP